MRFKQFLTEGFFNYDYFIDNTRAMELVDKFGDWEKHGTTWTMHDGENHLFTYLEKDGKLMTDMRRPDLIKLIDL